MKKILFWSLAISAMPVLSAEAHVRYLVSEDQVAEKGGVDFGYLYSVFSEYLNIFLIVITIIVAVILWIIAKREPICKKACNNISERADSYGVFIPWMLRLSLGIALIGSGISNTLVSPALSGFDAVSSVQIFIGFLIMSGLLVIPSTFVAIILYVHGFLIDPYLLGNLDFLATAVALMVLDNEKPGLDHLLGMPKMSPFKALKKYVPLILRVGIGGSMIYLAIYEKFLNPHISEVVVTDFGLLNIVPVSPEMWVLSAGLIELFIGLLLLFGYYTRLASGVAFIVLSLSFFYFNEDVASHITLFGILSALFVTRGGWLSLDRLRGEEQKVAL